MSDRSKLISRLIADRDFRADYIRAKLDIIIPSQLRGLRRREDLTQPQLAEMAGMKQARISAMETPGRVNFNRETLVRMAATYSVGLIVKFVPFSEMLEWENEYSQDDFNPTRLVNDVAFLEPVQTATRKRPRKRTRRPISVRIRIAAAVGAMKYRVPAQREGAQMNLFEPSAPLPEEKKYADVLTLTNRGGETFKDDPMRKAMAAASGAGEWRKYGT